MDKKNFAGLTVISFESRLSEAMAESIRRQGGVPVSAPSLREIPLTENAEAFVFGEKLIQGRIDMLICMTGVGTRILWEALETKYPADPLLKALSKVTVVARGPKPVKVLKEKNIPITLTVPEPNTWVEIIQVLDESQRGIPLEGKTVAVQEYGVSNPRLIAALKERKATVLQVPVYRWALPLDTKPLLQGIRQMVEGKTDIAVFTNAAQIQHLLRFASGEGLEKQLRDALKKIVMASIGPTTSEALTAQKLTIDFEPSHSKMGVMIGELAQASEQLVKEKREGPARSFIQSHSKSLSSAKETAALRKESLFLKACRREPTPVTPVWLMRQAGRYMEAYRKIRNKVSFLELCKNKELAAEVALAAVERLKVDAAILFSDILLIVEPMGLGLEYGAQSGPEIEGRISAAADVDQLKEIEPTESLSFVMDAVKLTRACLDPKIPLIGFSGAPFTLAAYMIEGGASRSFLNTKRLMYSDPGAWAALMEKLTRGIIKYLNGQIEAGADAVQLFDSWVGCLGPEEYRERVLPYTKAVIAGIKKATPVIHFGVGTTPFLDQVAQAGGDVIGVDFHADLDAAWDQVGQSRGVQGNLDPAVLCCPKEVIKEETRRILTQAAGRPGHIFNLGHGILPSTPEENAVALVDYVHELSHR